MTMINFRPMPLRKVPGSEYSPYGRSVVSTSSSFYKEDSSKERDDVGIHSQKIRRQNIFRRQSSQELGKQESSSTDHTNLYPTSLHGTDLSTANTSLSSEHHTFQKTVTFEKTARVKRIKPRHYYTEEQQREIWYQDNDYVEIKKRAIETVRRMMKGAKSTIGFTDDDDHTARGLECRTRIAATERKEFKAYARMLVLDEQEDQNGLGFKNDNRIRKMYLKASLVSSAKAQTMGQKDAEAANDISLNDVLKLVRHEHNCSL